MARRVGMLLLGFLAALVLLWPLAWLATKSPR